MPNRSNELAPIENSSLSNTKFSSVEIKECIPQHVELHTSLISSSELHHCAVVNSELINRKAFNTIIHNSKLDNSQTEACIAMKWPLAWTRFPPEIRMMILEYLVVPDMISWRTPVILKALRCANTDLYREALKIYYTSNTFMLDQVTYHRPSRLSDFGLHSITNLVVNISWPYQYKDNGRTIVLDEFVNLYDSNFAVFRNIKGLHVICNNGPKLRRWLSKAIPLYYSLKKLVVSGICYSQHAGYILSESFFSEISKVDHMLSGSTNSVRLATVTTTNVDEWFWEARPNETLQIVAH